MNYDSLNLVAVVDELSEEPRARPVADAVEFRVDTAAAPIEQLEAYDGELPVIAATEPTNENVTRMTERQLERLLSAVEIDAVEAVSVDLASVDEERLLTAATQAETDIHVTYHDFDRTPEFDVLMSILREAEAYGDAVTLAPTAETPDDALTFLSAVAEATNEGVVVGGAAMGTAGRHTHVVAPLYGSKLAFAPLTTESRNAVPGQFSLTSLNELVERTDEPPTQVALHESITNPMVKQE